MSLSRDLRVIQASEQFEGLFKILQCFISFPSSSKAASNMVKGKTSQTWVQLVRFGVGPLITLIQDFQSFFNVLLLEEI